MSRIYLPSNASAARLREAEHARRNRAEIVRELSWGRVTRRDLIKMGLFTAAGLLAPIGGLNPFVKSAYGQAPTGLPPTPLFACKEFTDPMPRFDVLPRTPVSSLNPQPTAEANQKMRAVQPALSSGSLPQSAADSGSRQECAEGRRSAASDP